MKIKIENFGIIKEFNFDSDKDLTMIFGQNNSGKSYAISVAYLIIKYLISENTNMRLFYFIEKELLNSIEKIDKNKIETDIKSYLEIALSSIFQKTFIDEIEKAFNSTFDSIENLQNQLSNNKIKITLEFNLISLEIIEEKKHLKVHNFQIMKKNIIAKKSKINKKFREKDKNIILYFCSKEDSFNSVVLDFIIYLFTESLEEIKEEIIDIHYLPASRSGLYQALSAFGQIIAELSKNRHLIRSSIELPSISEPLSDYYLSISSIKSKKIEDNFCNKIASKIEETLLNGKVSFDEKIKKVVFEPNNTNLKLDLGYTSSMVSEISPIVAYLRYVINNNLKYRYSRRFKRKEYKNSKTIIFIEEPEAHLHPKIQIKLMEIFAELVSDNIKIVITTHSDYMFNKFNNLIIDKKIDRDKTLSIQFKESSEGSVATESLLDEFGAEDENFIEASEELYNEKLELIEKLNSEN